MTCSPRSPSVRCSRCRRRSRRRWNCRAAGSPASLAAASPLPAAKPVEILQFGHWNHAAGPDFTEVAVRIGDQTRTGNSSSIPTRGTGIRTGTPITRTTMTSVSTSSSSRLAGDRYLHAHLFAPRGHPGAARSGGNRPGGASLLPSGGQTRALLAPAGRDGTRPAFRVFWRRRHSSGSSASRGVSTASPISTAARKRSTRGSRRPLDTAITNSYEGSGAAPADRLPAAGKGGCRSEAFWARGVSDRPSYEGAQRRSTPLPSRALGEVVETSRSVLRPGRAGVEARRCPTRQSPAAPGGRPRG